MGRAIVVACAVLVLGGAGCGDAPPDTSETVGPADAPPTTELEERETTTTRPRPTTTTSTTTTTTPPTTTTTTTTTTAPPTTTTTAPPPPPTTAPPPPPTVAPAGGGCDPNYTGCVPVDSDVDCAGGSGNGPSYVAGPVQVVGSDVYGLDNDGDGVGCET